MTEGEVRLRIERFDLREPTDEGRPRKGVVVSVDVRDEAIRLARSAAAGDLRRTPGGSISERLYDTWGSILVCGPLAGGVRPGVVAYELTRAVR